MTIPKNWYELALRYDVMKDLEKHPEIANKLGSYKNKFIKWCAVQRILFEADIFDEFKEFEEEIINNRLYNKDINLWKEISRKVFERDDYTCFYCGEKGGLLEVDHMMPISRGGSNDLSNLTTSCRRCNRQKRDKTVEEFKEWREKQ
ncbi:HNH endonuclease [Chengkuizengella axinellae]|uniref:HNH endonuclease n=1 Tax=Chengkuizengella axinellae TaxID=3064388 RepID=A0ABT9J882_9BACL|nr:HNH endonuclease [Chengkuizengella sp. 2205SS18-9]MDP5277200.1 HNH endonuclease [Chengkuizengella sp. 2205SS18-9]